MPLTAAGYKNLRKTKLAVQSVSRPGLDLHCVARDDKVADLARDRLCRSSKDLIRWRRSVTGSTD